jgi:hypothetical protein
MVLARETIALKGLNKIAQGNALGNKRPFVLEALKGRQNSSALSGLN